eukprot:403340698
MGNSQPKLTPKELARQNKRIVDKAVRQIDRERTKLQSNETKMLEEIKKLAKKNQHGPAKILSKDLVRGRSQVGQYYVMASQLKAISMKLSTAEINQSMVDALKGVNKVMEKVNASMDIHSIQEVLKEFAKQSEKMEMQQEMMNDAMDAGMDNADSIDEADKVYQQICDEIGVDLGDEHVGAGRNPLVNPVAQPTANNVDDLEARLNQLKK